MRAVVQRVREASVRVGGEIVGACGPGLVVLLGVAAEDGEAEAERLAGKIARLRVFENEGGRFDRFRLFSVPARETPWAAFQRRPKRQPLSRRVQRAASADQIVR